VRTRYTVTEIVTTNANTVAKHQVAGPEWPTDSIPHAQGAVPGDAVPKFLEEFELEFKKINEKVSRIREIEASIPK
jgi:hypothetical protein